MIFYGFQRLALPADRLLAVSIAKRTASLTHPLPGLAKAFA